jgi:acyl carrier protein
VALEEETGVQIPDSEVQRMSKVGHLVDFTRRQGADI